MNVTELTGKTIGFLASGGLDSCTITHWLTSRGVKVVTFTADLGQPDENNLDDVAKRMKACGAVDTVIIDLKEDVAALGLEMVQAQATYEGGYWLSTPIGRYVTTKGVLPYLLKRDIDVLGHGATGRGNDQVRFQLISNMYAPQVHVYAPWRDEEFLNAFGGGGRGEMIEYCEQHQLPIRHSKAKPYSTDANLIGLTHEAGALESLETPPSFVTPEMGVRITEAPNTPERVTLSFSKGQLDTINGEPVASLADGFVKLNTMAGAHGVGINLHLLENRFVGTKSRGVYEQPGIALCGEAYGFLLQAILDRRARRVMDFVSDYLAEQMYDGYGEDFASQLLKGVVAQVAAVATGTVTVELYKGNVSFVSLTDVPHSMYVEEHASMENIAGFDHKDSEGFLRVLGLSAMTIGKAGLASETDARQRAAIMEAFRAGAGIKGTDVTHVGYD